MSTHDADLQVAVDSTSVALTAGATEDLKAYLIQELAGREVVTRDDAWLDRMLEGIHSDPNYLIESEPDDYEPDRRKSRT